MIKITAIGFIPRRIKRKGTPENHDDRPDKYGGYRIAEEIPDQKQQDDVYDNRDDFRPGIQTVNNRIFRIILSEGNVSQHFSSSRLCLSSGGDASEDIGLMKTRRVSVSARAVRALPSRSFASFLPVSL